MKKFRPATAATVLIAISLLFWAHHQLTKNDFREVLLYEDEDTVALRIFLGADVNTVDEFGNAPLDYAMVNQDSLSYLKLDARDEEKQRLRSSNAGVVRLLLKAGADPNRVDEFGDTPLLKAAANGDSEIVRVLLSHGADVNFKNGDGSTALMEAMYAASDTVEALIKGGAAVDVADKYGDTPLLIAVQDGDVKMTKTLLSLGANVNHKNRHGESVLMLAMDSDHPESMLRMLLGYATPEDLNGSLLLKAIELRNLQMIKELIEYKIDVNEALKAGGKGRFAFLDTYETAPFLALLLNAGWDARGKDEFGNTALSAAMLNKDALAVAMLLNAGIDLNQADADGYTPLCSAIQNDDFSLIMDLLHRGALVDWNDYPLHLYLQLVGDPKQGVQIVGEMLDRGAKPNMKDQDGLTPLLHAVSSVDCPLEVIKLLVARGADVNAVYPDNFLFKGYSPLMLALDRKNDAEDVIKCLLNAGADPMYKPQGGDSVMEYAELHYEKLAPLIKKHKPAAQKKR